MKTPKTKLEACRAALALAERRLAESVAAEEALTAGLAALDPDDTAALSRAVVARDAARGRVEVFQARIVTARAALADATAETAQAERAAIRAQADAVEREIAALDSSLTADARAFRGRIAVGAAALRELRAKARGLAGRLGLDLASSGFETDRGAPWARITPDAAGHELRLVGLILASRG